MIDGDKDGFVSLHLCFENKITDDLINFIPRFYIWIPKLISKADL